MSFNLANNLSETAAIQPTSEGTVGSETTSALAIQHELPIPGTTSAEQEVFSPKPSATDLPQPGESIRLEMLPRPHYHAQFRADLAVRSARIRERLAELAKVSDELKRGMQGIQETIADIERTKANTQKYTLDGIKQGGEELNLSPEETRLKNLLMILTTLRRNATQP
ncbi:hypothetical protein JR316_0011470 [Psilocybe cubensis]|uniref:Uncharacterized protein n=1 Tax=Psilocybe cubensis TaxID=181762 RepID=A0ACB8GLH2_PSICU|nr:hypothetical protein JR316_0011470 [Psilocybe cubensis]KAH9475909.1 hypothetical protein JR316_0011470 [Psilocybe cubensis]